MKYLYKGNTKVELSGFGVVEPNSTIDTEASINNPMFQRIEGKGDVSLQNAKPFTKKGKATINSSIK